MREPQVAPQLAAPQLAAAPPPPPPGPPPDEATPAADNWMAGSEMMEDLAR